MTDLGLKRQPHLLKDWRLLCIISLSLVLHLWGIQRNLPYVPEADEPQIVERAVTMASSGNLNPGWFGAPGSTLLYPLTGAFHLWNAVKYNGMLFHPDPNLAVSFQANPWEFYLIGRLLCVAYAVMCVPLIYLIGRHVFDEAVGLAAALMYTVCRVSIFYAQMVRTDSAATFWGLLALWLIVRAADRPTAVNQAKAGAALGLGIASRYFMVTLIPVWIVLSGWGVLKAAGIPEKKRRCWAAAAGLISMGVAFILVTPYFALDFAQASESIRVEARSSHAGADGLSPLGNLRWYLGTALPATLFWPQAFAAAAAIGVIAFRRTAGRLALVGFVVVFLLGISASALHWQRWLIPITPIVFILAAYGVTLALEWARRRSAMVERRRTQLLAGCIALFSLWPLLMTVQMDIRQSRASTRVLAREWVMDNIAPQSAIAQEWYTAPLAGAPFQVGEWPSLPRTATIEPRDYYRDGFRYIIVSSSMYDRFLAEPERYPSQVSFYAKLNEQGTLLQTFEPSLTRGGPVVKIYELKP